MIAAAAAVVADVANEEVACHKSGARDDIVRIAAPQIQPPPPYSTVFALALADCRSNRVDLTHSHSPPPPLLFIDNILSFADEGARVSGSVAHLFAL